jgi:hypothetical protein
MSQDLFVARLDPSDGHVTMKEGWGGAQEDQIVSLVFDDGGDLYAGGSFKGSISVPTVPPTLLDTADPAALDGLLVRMSSGGTPLWAKRLGAVGHPTVIRALTFISSTPGIAFTGISGGDVSGACDWPSGGVNTADVFHAVVKKDGSCLYGVPGGSSSAAGAFSIDSDSMGRIVTAGDFKGAINLGPSPPIVAFGTDTDGFLARVDWNHGAPQHAVATFGNGGGAGAVDQAMGLYVDKSNKIGLTGSFMNSVSFSGKNFNAQGSFDAFVARYDATTLSPLWVKAFGDNLFQQGRAVTADPIDDAVIAAGIFQGTLVGAGVSPPTASPGFQGVYLMKLSP